MNGRRPGPKSSTINPDRALNHDAIWAPAADGRSVVVAGGHRVVRVSPDGKVDTLATLKGHAFAISVNHQGRVAVLSGLGSVLRLLTLQPRTSRVLSRQWSGDRDGRCTVAQPEGIFG